MKFDYIIGNPPYQGENHQQIYTDFYLNARELSNCFVLIFPTGWQGPKKANNLGKLNTPEVKQDKQIVFIDNRKNVFPGIAGAEWTNIILWKRGYDNGLDGKQLMYTDGQDPKEILLAHSKEQIAKPKEIEEFKNLVCSASDFKSMQTITSTLKPYGLRTDVIDDYEKYNLPKLNVQREKKSDLKVYCKAGIEMFVPKDYPLPKRTAAIDTYKVFVPYAWGNMSEKSGLGGAFSDIIIGMPNEICTETYQEQGRYKTFDLAKKHAKYIMTRFARALLYVNKYSQHSTTAWGAVPIQSFEEKWWNLTIREIDEKLMEKYNVPQAIKNFVFNNFQIRDESNIINFDKE